VLCAGSGATLDEVFVETVIHEYFHATQYAYPNVLADYRSGAEKGWIIEGTAEAAIGSYFGTEMARSDDYPLRRIDIPLESEADDHEYEVQDFWVYLGRRLNQGLDYLIPFFEAGSTTADVDSVLRATYGLELGKVYWDYVKNQLMVEEDIVIADEMSGACSLVDEAYQGGPVELSRFGGAEYETETDIASGTLGPYESRYINLAFDAEVDLELWHNLWERTWEGFYRADDESSSPTQYKAYKRNGPNCSPSIYGRDSFEQEEGALYDIVVTNLTNQTKDYEVYICYGQCPT